MTSLKSPHPTLYYATVFSIFCRKMSVNGQVLSSLTILPSSKREKLQGTEENSLWTKKPLPPGAVIGVIDEKEVRIDCKID